MKHLVITAAIAGTLAWSVSAQTPAPANTASTQSATPRTADGHPDLSGVWWQGQDIGGRPAGGAAAGRGGAGRGGGRGAGQRPVTFSSLYTSSAQAKAKTLSDKDDPSLDCTPTAFGTLNVSLFDVGAVGQIVQTPKFVILLTETYNGFQIIPIDGRPHRDNVPPSNRGDAVGRWDGDTLVVDKNNFTDTSWISAEGRVSFHSDALHVVERYHRVDRDTLEIDATLEDPTVLTKPWVVPKQTLKLAPFDQVMELACQAGDVKALIEGANAQPSPGKH